MTSTAPAPVHLVEVSAESRWSTALHLAQQRIAGTLHGPLYQLAVPQISVLSRDQADEAFDRLCKAVDEPFDDHYDDQVALAVWRFLFGDAKPCVTCLDRYGLGPKCSPRAQSAVVCDFHEEQWRWLKDPRRVGLQP